MKQIYPFATQDGKAIPLDIIKSAGLIRQAFAYNTPASFVLPIDNEVGLVVATEACFLRFGTTIPNPLVDGTMYSDMYLIPKDTAITISLIPGTVYVQGISNSGILYMQAVEKWAGLSLTIQTQRK